MQTVYIVPHPRHYGMIVYSNGFVYNKLLGAFCKNQLTNRGYVSVSFNNKTYSIHRLVVEAFLGEIPEKMDINHKDGDKLNNDYSNLEICTRKENIRHAHSLGLYSNIARGERSARCTISDETRATIQTLLAKNLFTCKNIAESLGISKHIVYHEKKKLLKIRKV